MEVYIVSNNNKSTRSTSDEQAVRKNLSKELDHELANEPLTAAERLNNKKTKKRQ
ncbi:small acid-soluble spore protein O [Solibacillus silvestris]|uniref:Small acid-soluble spore protein O n=2 Tax=Solibacillus TaxID=648800 RepID=A0ABX3ZHA7_9BACL|nr:small acid-soluble spore protein O [Solibacillus kalamii]OBW60573.1 small acid-soluble spore protein O [Solibacillus silvestris]OUZ39106.1 small acid-soluble spore protein O [Solibacillus kalamii]